MPAARDGPSRPAPSPPFGEPGVVEVVDLDETIPDCDSESSCVFTGDARRYAADLAHGTMVIGDELTAQFLRCRLERHLDSLPVV